MTKTTANTLPTATSSTDPSPVVVLGPDEGQRFWLLTGERILKAGAAQTGSWSLGEERMPTGTATPMHVHLDEHEAYYMLEGELELHLADGAVRSLHRGDFALVPAGTAHSHVVVTDSRWLGISGPAFEAFLGAAGVPVVDGERPSVPDFDRIIQAAERNGTSIVGPPPSLVQTPTVARPVRSEQ